MLLWFRQLVQAGRCHSRSTAFLAQRLDTSMEWYRSDVAPSLAKMLMRISFGSLLMGGQQESSTCISWKLGTPNDDSESLAPRKKSDSSLSAGAGEAVEDDERESSCSSGLALDLEVMVLAGAAEGIMVTGAECEVSMTNNLVVL